MSLYRTYRPQTFADVTGQEHVVTTLEQAVEQGKISHAYLFAGTRGTGKTSVARILAKEMLTQGIEDKKIVQQIKEAVDEGSLVDCVEIDAASNRGIDDIRSLLEKIQFTPVVAAAKVYIIDEVHMLTKEAFNALLKTLEEPPSYAFFILATTELQKIPATIQSRCQRFQFRQIREEDIIRRLQYIADQEKITVERPALRAIAHHAHGSLRDAISLLDQLRSLPEVTLVDVQERIGEAGHEHVEKLLAAVEAQDGAIILEVTRTMEEQGASFESALRLLLAAAREKLHVDVGSGKDAASALLLLDTLLHAVRDVRIAPVPALVFESALLSAITPTSPLAEESAPASTTPRIPVSRVKKAVKAAAVQIAQTLPPEETVQITTTEAPELTLETIQEHWPQIVAAAEPPYVRMSLKNGQPTGMEDNAVVVRFSSAFHRDKASSNEGAKSVQEALEKLFKRQVKLKFVLDAEKRAVATESEVNLAEAAMEVF